jgi:protein tyrosine phosphatase (PTP) superfamily phosphohydrolase (DUF442 family)
VRIFSRRIAVVAGAVCFTASAAAAQVVKQDVAGIRNFAKVESTVACAGAITADAIPAIKKMGYASIINLRLATEPGADVEVHTAAAKVAGITYIHIPFSAANPDAAAVDAFLKAITAPGVAPAFIH